MSAAPGRSQASSHRSPQGEGNPVSAAPGRSQASSHRSPQGEGNPVSAAPGRSQASSHRSPQGEGTSVSQRLVYVIGPSGAGKDSVLQGLREAWPDAASAHWVRRTITRAPQAGGERHEAVDPDRFSLLCEAGAFAMHWVANGLAYGVRRSELQPLRDGRWVFVNGSRAWLPCLQQQWPDATVVHIGASPAVLARRLAARGRESAEAVAERLARQVPLNLPPGAIRIDNDHELDEAVTALRQALQARGQPAGAGF